MSHTDFLKLINSLYLFVFVCELSLVLILLLNRVREYRQANWPLPKLLKRDLVLFGGLLMPFAAIFVRRWLGIDISTEIIWVVATATPAVVAVAYWIFVEYFEIGTGG